MKKLAHEITVVIEVTAYNLEIYIKEIYDRDIEIYCNEEHDNTVLVKNVSTEYYDEYDEERVKEWLSTGKGDYIVRSLLNHMCKEGHLVAGKYLIDGTW